MPLNINNYTNEILKNISFSLKAGEHLVILGSNGVGKSTLGRVLCGMIPSTAVSIDDLNLSKVYGDKRARLINYIPPALDVFDAFITVRAFLELGFIGGVVGVQHPVNIDETLERLHITHLSEKNCKSLSSGESQLLLIASALLHNASYTILDEPTANLDPQKIQLLFGLLNDSNTLQSKIIITHNLDLAYKLGYDILYLAEGAIAFHGSSAEFFAPLHLERLYGGSVEKQGDNIVVKL